jgi:hypothetical protein
MDIGFELAAYRDSYRTVSRKIQFSLAGFLASQFLLFSSQTTGFQVNKSLIRTHRPKKIYGDLYLWFDHGMLLSTSSILMNVAIRLVRHIDGLLLSEGPMLSEKGIVLYLPLDERRAHAKFRCSGFYCVQMHKERTEKQTFFVI